MIKQGTYLLIIRQAALYKRNTTTPILRKSIVYKLPVTSGKTNFRPKANPKHLDYKTTSEPPILQSSTM